MKKLTDDQAEEVVRLAVEERLTLRELAKRFGCSTTPIKRVLDERGISTMSGTRLGRLW